MCKLIFGNKRGSGTLMAFLVLTVVFTLGVALVSLTVTNLNASKRDSLRARALACSEAGIDRAIALLMTKDQGGWRGALVGYPATNEHYKVTITTGSGITSGKIVATSSGTVTEGGSSVTRTVKAVLKLKTENINCWNNVIFGGVGQAGKSINGNVKIRGSVHLLGDGEQFTDLDGDGRWDNDEFYTDSNHNGSYDAGEPFIDIDGDGHRDSKEPFVDANGNGTRDPALTVTDLAEEISGTANLGNNYNGMPLDLRSRIPAVPDSYYGGEAVESLDTKLRVKHGKVNISGSATVGNPNVSGNSLKETITATYVSDGFGGNAGTGSVYSDNGYRNGYDLGDGIVTMPIIDSGEYVSGGTTYGNYLAYLRAKATVVTGNVTFTSGVAQTISGPNGSITMDASGNMTISGIVYVDGDISFGPSKSRITYSGKGTLVTPNSMYVHCDVLPKTKFPTTDGLGLVARHHIELATGGGDAQLTMALAMYAQHQIISNKQSEIAGTMVTSFFSMANVPSIYQVPELANALPPGMPGGDPIWYTSINVDSWKEM